jgi:hypothetical protein
MYGEKLTQDVQQALRKAAGFEMNRHGVVGFKRVRYGQFVLRVAKAMRRIPAEELPLYVSVLVDKLENRDGLRRDVMVALLKNVLTLDTSRIVVKKRPSESA